MAISRSAKRWTWPLLVLASWPVVCALLWFTGNEPSSGQRWADVNQGRGQFLAIFGALWMFGLLLWLIWTLTFSVLLPLFEKRRELAESQPKL